jgi:hypothetical protein
LAVVIIDRKSQFLKPQPQPSSFQEGHPHNGEKELLFLSGKNGFINKMCPVSSTSGFRKWDEIY